MRERVLLVDDDESLLGLETAILESEGYDVVAVNGGKPALAAVREQEFHVVISDLDMPGISGLQLLEQMKENAPDTVFVICTSHGHLDVAVACLKAGAYDFVAKPFTLELFQECVRRAVQHRRMRDLTNMYQVAQVVFGTLEPRDLPRVVLETATDVLQAQYAAIYVHNGDQGFIAGHEHKNGIKPGPGLIRTLSFLSQQASDNLEPLRLTGQGQDPHALAHPLFSGNRLHGVLWVLRVSNHRPFGVRDVEQAASFAATASLGLDNVRLVAELKARVNALEQAKQRLYVSARLEGLGRMAVQTAGQLQNAIDYVRSNLGDLGRFVDKDPAVTADDARKRLSALQGGVGRMTEVIADLVMVANARDRTKFEISQVVHLAIRIARARANVTLDVTHEALVEGNPGHLAQAFAAILHNADEASGNLSNPKISVKQYLEGGKVHLSFVDTGEGIPDADITHVTEPFFSRRGRDGLGLHQVKEVVENHNGQLSITSRLGYGTIVTIRLPAEHVEDDLAAPSETDEIIT